MFFSFTWKLYQNKLLLIFFFYKCFFLNCQMWIRISVLFKYFEFCSIIEMTENEANLQNIFFTKPAFIHKNVLIKELRLVWFSKLFFYFLTHWMDCLVIFALCFAIFWNQWIKYEILFCENNYTSFGVEWGENICCWISILLSLSLDQSCFNCIWHFKGQPAHTLLP